MPETTIPALMTAALAGDGPLARAVRDALAVEADVFCEDEECLAGGTYASGERIWHLHPEKVPRDTSGWPQGAVAGALLVACAKAHDDAPETLVTWDALEAMRDIGWEFVDDSDAAAIAAVAEALEKERNGG
jgi:hypothetical protein